MNEADPLIAFRERFHRPRALIGMVHVGALPGTPAAHQSIEAIVERAIDDARVYRAAGCTAVAIENMHDRAYLAGANREALAAAHACGADFVRVEGFVFAHVADEGIAPSARSE